ncbi:DMT family transporter [Aliishimia ponticola]|uniref:DMT family transporter n=1 Tax=Aliishimia ponticola TaxID=2499833 RepID=A0A4S4NI92_9RHOB|nr:DMT family transporter [Aliishimia ponticola]THH38427.1 DMT family transporter [Aliishimia ponticola]
MQRKANIDALGASLLIGFSLVLAFNQVVIKLGNDGFSPAFMAFLRSAGGAVMIGGWIVLRGRKLAMKPKARIWGVILGVLFAVEFVCLFNALDLTTVSRASVLFYTMPVWLSLAAHVLIPGERIGGMKAIGLGLAVLGVAVALSDRGAEGQSYSLLGDALALVGAMLWAAIALVLRLSPARDEAPETQLFWQLLWSSPILLVAALMLGPLLRDLHWAHVAGLGFQIVVVVTLAFLLWFWLLTIYPASGVASFSFLSPVFSVILGWLLLGEQIGPRVWIALGLVALGIVLVNRPVRSRKMSPPQPPTA